MTEPSPQKAPVATVLLVEDDQALCSALQFALRIEGWQVELRASGEALLECPIPAAPVCLVVDIQLPGMSGADAVVELRRRGDKSPIILITSDPQPVLHQLAARIEAQIVEKPLISGELLAAIRRHLA